MGRCRQKPSPRPATEGLNESENGPPRMGIVRRGAGLGRRFRRPVAASPGIGLASSWQMRHESEGPFAVTRAGNRVPVV